MNTALIVLMSLVSIEISAHDIEVKNSDEVTIYYVWINNNTELAVSFRGTDSSTYNEYKNTVNIPEFVTYNGTDYPVTSIGESAFSGCTMMTNVTIPNSVESIGQYAFAGCSGLTNLTIPNSVKTCGRNAFGGSSIRSVVLSNSLVSIEKNAFYNCTRLKSVDIPNSVTSIGEAAFRGCTGLINVNIPNSVTSIGSDAFYGCNGLTSVKLPEALTTIEAHLFFNCTHLYDVNIPNSVTSIGVQAFSSSHISSITIPSSVTTINSMAFSSCSDLSTVYVQQTTPIVITASEFSNRANATLYVPYGCVAAYKAATGWKEFKEIKEMYSEKCATPTITFANGKLTFSSETEGVEFIYNITAADATTSIGNNVPLSPTYHVSVYATKECYENSDVATADIDFKYLKGDMDNDGTITINDIVILVNIILGKESAPQQGEN